jgi:hypothetical protein
VRDLARFLLPLSLITVLLLVFAAALHKAGDMQRRYAAEARHEAYRLGAMAFEAGASCESNPYGALESASQREACHTGWLEASVLSKEGISVTGDD